MSLYLWDGKDFTASRLFKNPVGNDSGSFSRLDSARQYRACEENVVFMALSSDTRPHFTTIANFISTMGNEVLGVFTDVLTVCYAEVLIGKKMFAVDGCKISANCLKEWSGTRAELYKKAKRIEESIQKLMGLHRNEDERPLAEASIAGEWERSNRCLEMSVMI